MRKFTRVFLLGICACTASAHATDLIDAYNDALINAPALKAALDDRKVKSHLTSEAMAGFLPKLEGKYEQGHEVAHTDLNLDLFDAYTYGLSDKTSASANNFNLELVQPIFNYKAWVDYDLAKKMQVLGDYEVVDAQQNLMLTVAEKYFAVTILQDKLSALEAEKNALTQQEKFMQEKMRHGLESQLDVEQITTQLNFLEAKKIELAANLNTAIQDLQSVTGKTYHIFSHLNPKFSPKGPQPENLEYWVNAVEQGNLGLHIASANLELTRVGVKAAGADGYPQLNAVVDYDDYTGVIAVLGAQKYSMRDTIVGAQLKVPIFEGGYYTAKEGEARDKLSYSLDKFDEYKAQILVGIHQAYGAALALTQKIHADQMALDNAEKTLEFSTKAYQTGLKGSLDLLNAEENVYRAKSDDSEDHYQYVVNALRLKYLSGILKPSDMQNLNALLLEPKAAPKPPV